MERVELAVGDGSRMNAFVAEPAPAASPKAAIIVLQEAFGVNGHIRDVAQRFARLGLTAIAPELFHRTAPGFEGSYGDFEAVRPNLQALTLEGMRVDIAAAYEWLTDTARIAPARIAAIGFCMGGRAVFTANAALALAAAVSFTAGASTRMDAVERPRNTGRS
jgi:carboxymethylenebutenolidase